MVKLASTPSLTAPTRTEQATAEPPTAAPAPIVDQPGAKRAKNTGLAEGHSGKDDFKPTGPVAAPRQPAPIAPSMTAPLQAVSQMASATAVNPIEAIKLVRNGDVDLVVPLKEGQLIDYVKVPKGGSSMHLVFSVKDGNIDFAKSKTTFKPPLDAPIGMTIHGVDMTSDGRAEVDLRHMINPKVGTAAPAKLTEFIDQLARADSLPLTFLGIGVKDIPLKTAPAAPGAPGTPAASTMTELKAKADFSQAKISVKNVAFQTNQVPFGSVGSAKLGPDSKITIEGTLGDLKMSGHVTLQDLSLNAGGTVIKGGKGAADLEVRLRANAQLKGVVETKISNLQLSAEYAVGRRENGDFLELAKGKMQNTEINVTETLGDGLKPSAHLKIGRFEGLVTSGRITIPDGSGTARVNLGRTQVSGTVEVTDKHVMLSGDVDLNMQVDDFDSPGASATFKLNEAKLSGKAHANFDSEKGVQVDGNVRMTAKVHSGKVTTQALTSQVLDGTIESNITKFEFGAGADGKLDIRGPTSVDFAFQNLNLGSASGIALSAGAGRIAGKGDLRITNDGINIENAKLRIKGAVEDGRVTLGSNVALDIKKGSTIDAVMTRAVFGDQSEFDLSSFKVDATLDGGTVLLPGQQTMRFKDGAKVKFALDRLQVSKEGGIPKASGSIELTASVGAKQVDLATLTSVPGVVLDPIDGVEHTFKLKLGRFSIEPNGTFDISDVNFGLEATVRRFGGKLVN